MAIARGTSGVSGRAPTWLALTLGGALAGALAFSGAALAEEEAEWPRGHYPLPEEGNVIGETYTVTVEDHEDTLMDIAREHNVGYEEIIRANPEVSIWIPGEGTEVTIPGRFILPDAEPTGVVINIAELRLYYFPKVREGETPRVETYPIGIGREGFDTQTTMRLEDPAWYPPRSMREEAAERGEPAPAVVPPGPDNPLGRHAVLLDIPGYLIHGTNEPDGIGMRASRGCIRMFPEDIESVFHNVPVGTRVNMIDQPIKVGWQDGQPLVQVFKPLEEQEHGMSALIETIAQLNAGSANNGVAFDYEQLRGLLEAPSGQLVALEPPPEREPEPAPALNTIFEELVLHEES
ncbi:L,D-transpeptidase family protein [Halomonas sp. BM-2019]|uniref:L,D-transpeptidase family protein n=1 Tax=Halomonas sp. BM-2019 TaxID=2811227 RepID=UPI001B3C46FE|nr:MAG: L,D-transpeptidase family protein [Halomonas sp. BM-2019]